MHRPMNIDSTGNPGTAGTISVPVVVVSFAVSVVLVVMGYVVSAVSVVSAVAVWFASAVVVGPLCVR